MGYFFLALLWMIVGGIFSLPYTFLASGDSRCLFLMAIISPVLAIILYIFYEVSPFFTFGSKRKKYLWLAILYICSPVVLNGVSYVFGWFGLETTKLFFFEFRFFVLILIPALLFLYFLYVLHKWGREEEPISTRHE